MVAGAAVEPMPDGHAGAPHGQQWSPTLHAIPSSLPSTPSPKSRFASNHSCACCCDSNQPQPATTPSETPAVVVAVVAGATVVVGAAVVAGAVVVVGAALIVGAAVVVAATVVVDTAVVVGAGVAAGATVVTGVAVSELPPHPEATNKNVRTTACFLTVSVCHPSPEGGGGCL